MQLLFVILILSTAALLGNEFSIGVFIHPVLARTDHERFLPVIQVFAALFGKVMPFWMATTLVLHLALLGLSWHWPAPSTVLLTAATLVWIAIIIFSLVGPVHINNRVKSMGSPPASNRLARTETTLGPSKCGSSDPDRMGVSCASSELPRALAASSASSTNRP